MGYLHPDKLYGVQAALQRARISAPRQRKEVEDDNLIVRLASRLASQRARQQRVVR